MFLYSFVFVPQNVFTFECTSVKLENLFFNVNVPQQAWLIHVLGRGQEGGGRVRVWKCKRGEVGQLIVVSHIPRTWEL